MEICQVVVVPEGLSLVCSIRWNNNRWCSQGIAFRHTLACLFLEIRVSHFEKRRKAQNARAAARRTVLLF